MMFGKRLVLVTDAWHPQTNGVVHTLNRLVNHLRSTGTEVLVLAPDDHVTWPLPSYREIRIACNPWKAVNRLVRFQPTAVHVATEGPLGLWVSGWLRRRRLRFTTSFHTRFPEYLSLRYPCIPLSFGYAVERWFHGRAEHTMVGTPSLIKELEMRGVGRQLVHWPRGVDTARFNPNHRSDDIYHLPRPIWLYVGRVAHEKSLEDFLSLDLPGSKVVVGDGPERPTLQRRFPDTVFRGFRYGHELSEHFASADCFVFPSRTETFGNVVLEAFASGLPVASVPAPGPKDLIQTGINGCISDDLQSACLQALQCSRTRVRASASAFTLARSHELFQRYLVPLYASLPATTAQSPSSADAQEEAAAY